MKIHYYKDLIIATSSLKGSSYRIIGCFFDVLDKHHVHRVEDPAGFCGVILSNVFLQVNCYHPALASNRILDQHLSR
jgi:hypothetical protein